MALVAATLATACLDQQHPVGPAVDAQAAVAPIADPPQSVVPLAPPRTLRDEYTAIAHRVPGGFGGFYFAEDGELRLLLKDPSQDAAARTALAQEFFVIARRGSIGGERFDMNTVRVAPARYSHAELHQWLDALLVRLTVGITMSGVRVHSNQVLVGVRSDEMVAGVHRVARDIGLPDDAIVVEVRPPAPTFTELTDRIRPVPGGVQIRTSQPNNPSCTIGPNVLRLQAGGVWQDGYIVASHCTRDPFAFNSGNVTHFFQATGSGTDNHVGNEVMDPPLFSCVEDPTGCRNSDAALAFYPSYATGQLASIAQTTGRNNNDLTISGSSPRFTIIGEFNWAVDGETLEKVGRTTGWSGGIVLDGCITLEADLGHSIRCAMIVEAEAGGGDSGAPVFEITSGSQVRLRGTLWGGYGDCWWGVDPVHGSQTLFCDQFVASNLGGIKMDLDPNGYMVYR